MVSDETVFATLIITPCCSASCHKALFPLGWSLVFQTFVAPQRRWPWRELRSVGGATLQLLLSSRRWPWSYAVLVELLCSYFSVGRVRLKGRVLSGSAPVGCVMKVGIIDIRYQWHFYNFNTFMRNQIAIHRSLHMFQHFNWIFIHRAILGTCDPWNIWSQWWGDMTWPTKDNDKDKEHDKTI